MVHFVNWCFAVILRLIQFSSHQTHDEALHSIIYHFSFLSPSLLEMPETHVDSNTISKAVKSATFVLPCLVAYWGKGWGGGG